MNYWLLLLLNNYWFLTHFCIRWVLFFFFSTVILLCFFSPIHLASKFLVWYILYNSPVNKPSRREHIWLSSNIVLLFCGIEKKKNYCKWNNNKKKRTYSFVNIDKRPRLAQTDTGSSGFPLYISRVCPKSLFGCFCSQTAPRGLVHQIRRRVLSSLYGLDDRGRRRITASRPYINLRT